jgi:hypothetical protein
MPDNAVAAARVASVELHKNQFRLAAGKRLMSFDERLLGDASGGLRSPAQSNSRQAPGPVSAGRIGR